MMHAAREPNGVVSFVAFGERKPLGGSQMPASQLVL